MSVVDGSARIGSALLVVVCAWAPAFLTAEPRSAERPQAELADPLEEVVVLGSYLGDRVADDETRVSVGSAELRAIEAADAEQILRRLPGVSVFRPGGPGGVSEVFLRGAESNFTAVYVDGVRLNNSANTRGGSFDFSTLAPHGIERVDIAMGAMSAIYGSDAMAGVVRIETGYPEAGGVALHGEVGTHGDWRGGAAGTAALGDGVRLSARISESDGGDAVDGARLDLTRASARLAGQHANGRWRIDLRHARRDRTSYPEVSGGPEFAVLPDLETAEGEETSLAARLDHSVNARWSMDFLASWAHIEDRSATPAVPPGMLDGQPAFTSDSRYRRGEFRWVNRLDFSDRDRLAFGLNVVGEEGRDEGTVDLGFAVLPNAYELDRTTASVFAEWAHRRASGLETSVALRVDDAEDMTRVSGKLGIARTFTGDRGRVWARAANGFKLPSFFALGNPLFGNPDLRPEKVASLEVGYDRSLGNGIDAGVSVFTSRYEDLVDFDFETFRNVNRGRIDVDGLSFRAEAELTTDLALSADLTLSDIDSDSGELRRRPETTGGVQLTWWPLQRGGAWSLDAAVRYVGERLITSIPTGDVEDGAYWFVDATARYRASRSLAFWFALDNAFDAAYQHAPGFPAPGRGARIGAELRF